MSSSSNIDWECPKCSAMNSSDVYDSVNYTISPELIKNLLKNKLNVCKCSKCNSNIFINKGLLVNIPSSGNPFTSIFICYYNSKQSLDLVLGSRDVLRNAIGLPSFSSVEYKDFLDWNTFREEVAKAWMNLGHKLEELEEE